jgi:hypothetical protein
MTDAQTVILAVAGWLATTWLAYRWGLRTQRLGREEDAKSAIRMSRVSFVGFLRSWVVSFSRKIYRPGGWERDHSAFFDAIPEFVHICEHIRADLSPIQRSDFSERVARIQATKRSDFYKDKFDDLVSEIESLASFIEDA